MRYYFFEHIVCILLGILTSIFWFVWAKGFSIIILPIVLIGMIGSFVYAGDMLLFIIDSFWGLKRKYLDFQQIYPVCI